MENTNFKIAELSKKLEQLVSKTINLFDYTENKNQKEILINELKELNDRSNLKIAFVGQYSSGKSTIISALTGNKNIKIDANVATNIVSEYEWNNIILMDTPGILAGKVEQHDERTKNALKECDLIVYVLTSQLFDDIIFDNFIDLAYNQKLSDKILIVVNKMSMEAGEFNTLTQEYTESINAIFQEKGYQFNFKVVFIDAADYIDGLNEKDKEFIELSNFNTYINLLNEFVHKKGLIKKRFDTPIRILKGHLTNIAITEVDPNLKKLYEQYTSRLQNSLINIKRQVALILNNFEENCIKDIYNVSSKIGELNDKDIENEIESLKKEIVKYNVETANEIEKITTNIYEELIKDIDEFINKESIKLFSLNLEAKIESPNISIEERSNLEKQRKILEWLKNGNNIIGQKIPDISLFGKISQASGSQMHKAIYNTGKFFGHKFKSWEAVKITSNLSKTLKYGIPVVSFILSTGMEIYELNQEKKRINAIKSAKDEFEASFRSYITKIRREFEKEVEINIIENFNNKLKEIDESKMSLINSTIKNETIKKAIIELDTEYVDFIEIIEN